MDERTADKIILATHWPRTMAATALGVLALFLLVGVVREFSELRYIGTGVPATNTITVSGEGEVFAVPDTATFSVTVQEEAVEVKDAQDVATKKVNEIIAFLKGEGIEEKDIRTADYNVYPQYDYIQTVCRDGYCPPGRQELRGFQVSQTLTVKVRDTEKAGNLLSGVGELGASSVSGLSFTIDDEDALKREARGQAIEDARTKAAELAKQLNVRLVRIIGFSESEGGYPPIPYAYGRGGDMVAMEAKAIAPEIPVGENKIVSNVSVTYEIR
ncbi:SIMPL domain-containing protein [Candidatus Kaiserbacteria bacterium]|nr:SIMPL domain-containing protein [Candidatus Kaiserbacteria bacterium]